MDGWMNGGVDRWMNGWVGGLSLQRGGEEETSSETQ